MDLDQKVDWSNTPRNIQEEISITYKGLDKEGKALIEFKVEANQLTNTLTYLEKVLSENDFARRKLYEVFYADCKGKGSAALYCQRTFQSRDCR